MVWGDDDDVVQLPAFASANRAKNECGQLEIHPVVAAGIPKGRMDPRIE